MISAFIWFSAGLVVGWNFLSQPSWVKKALDLFVKKVKDLFKDEEGEE